jgi:hypothetical protein
MVCRTCKQNLSEELFAFRNKEKGIRRTQCLECTRKRSRRDYAQNREKRLAKIYAARQANQETCKELFAHYWTQHSCTHTHKQRRKVIVGGEIYAVSQVCRGAVTISVLQQALENNEVRCFDCTYTQKTVKPKLVTCSLCGEVSDDIRIMLIQADGSYALSGGDGEGQLLCFKCANPSSNKPTKGDTFEVASSKEKYQRICKKHGLQEHTQRSDSQGYRCTYCTRDYSQKRAKQNVQNRKARLAEARLQLGNRCSKCGYSTHPVILHFHHKNPSEKEGLVSRLATSNQKVFEAEVNKCELLCPNCHAEHHDEDQSKDTVLEGNVIFDCQHHGKTPAYYSSGHGYGCKKCRSERVMRKRRQTKQQLVDAHGGKCIMCKYDKSIRALHFHHRVPSEKSFGLGVKGITYSFEAMLKEAKKCDLLCANCHAEAHIEGIHTGM